MMGLYTVENKVKGSLIKYIKGSEDKKGNENESE
jgi:hypothetical protein